MRALSSCWKRVVWGNTAQWKQRLLAQAPVALPRCFVKIVRYCPMGVLHLLFLDCPGACAVFRPTGPDRFLRDWLLTQSEKKISYEVSISKGMASGFQHSSCCSLAVITEYRNPMSKVCRKFEETVNIPYPNWKLQNIRKNHLSRAVTSSSVFAK